MDITYGTADLEGPDGYGLRVLLDDGRTLNVIITDVRLGCEARARTRQETLRRLLTADSHQVRYSQAS